MPVPHISKNRLSTAPRVALYLHFVHCHILAECVVGCDLQFVCETMCDSCVKGPGSGKCARTQVVQVPGACHVLHCRTFEGNGVWPRCGTGEQAQEVVKGLDVVVADHLLNKFTTLHCKGVINIWIQVCTLWGGGDSSMRLCNWLFNVVANFHSRCLRLRTGQDDMFTTRSAVLVPHYACCLSNPVHRLNSGCQLQPQHC